MLIGAHRGSSFEFRIERFGANGRGGGRRRAKEQDKRFLAT